MKSLFSGRKRRRLALWGSALVAAGLTVTAWVRAEDASRLAEASALLASGDVETAGTLFAGLVDSGGVGARARAGLKIAAALGADTDADVDGTLDTSPFRLEVLTRRAFDDGDFGAVLELADLADQDGRSIDPLVRTAALIESGDSGTGATGFDNAVPPGASDFALGLSIDHYLESTRDSARVILRDRRGKRLGTLDARGELDLATGVPAEIVPRAVTELAAQRQAPSVRLTLDREISEAARDAFGRFRGSIVVLDPSTGEVLAAVSDRRTFQEGGTPAFEQLREPASIAKLITTTAALRAGLDPDELIGHMRCRGHQSFDGQLLYCPYIAGPLRGLDRALAVSCNVAFADLGVKVGRRRMLEEHRLYGFGVDLGPFPGGRIVEDEGDDRQLADLSIGLEATEITPLHAALLAAVMANDGVMPSPSLVLADDGRLGLHPRPLPPAPGRRVLDSSWLPQILKAMETVAKRGTAQAIAPPSFPVAMKTGTASDPRYGFHVNYIGVGPMPEPRLAFAVRITDQGTSRQVRYVARVVTRRLLRNLARIADQRGWLDGRPPLIAESRRRPTAGTVSTGEPPVARGR